MLAELPGVLAGGSVGLPELLILLSISFLILLKECLMLSVGDLKKYTEPKITIDAIAEM